MARDDLAQLIADHLDALPLPNGKKVRLMHFSNFPNGHHPEIQAKVKERAQIIGKAIAHLIETHGGYAVSHPSDPKPIEQTGRKVAKAYCAHCGNEVLHLAVGDDMTAQLSAQAMRMIQQMKPECPHI